MTNFDVGILKQAGISTHMWKALAPTIGSIAGTSALVGGVSGGLLGGLGNKIINDGSFLSGAKYGALVGAGVGGIGAGLGMSIPMAQTVNSFKKMNNIENATKKMMESFTKYQHAKLFKGVSLGFAAMPVGILGGAIGGTVMGD